jgi:hypothetical protein
LSHSAPAFFTAGIYVILGRLIRKFGPGVSPLSPATYLYIFCSIDFVSLLLQAIGGGLASAALGAEPEKDASPGNNTMLTGIVFQLAATVVFTVLFASVVIRARKAKLPQMEDKKVKLIIAATAFSVTLVITRGIYRTIELSQGWNGYLMTHQQYVIALDGTMMILAVLVFNFANPGWSESGNETPLTDKNESSAGEAHTIQV